MMNYISGILFFFWILTYPVLSQTVKDTIKSSNKKRADKDGKVLYKDTGKVKTQTPVSIEIPDENFFIPLNLKIYQKALTNDIQQSHNFSSQDFATGMSDDELIAFSKNKVLTERMLVETYGNDIINLKKILEKLGITKDQIVAVAAILKFLFYHPYLL